MKAENHELFVPQTLFDSRGEKEIEIECTLADYLPNISRILRVDAELLKDGIDITGERAEIRGQAVFYLLYESDYRGKLKSVSYSADYSQRFDLKGLGAEEVFATAEQRCAYVSCKTLNPRRFILKCRAETELCVRTMKPFKSVEINGGDGFFYQTKQVGVQTIKTPIERDFTLEESISIEKLPPINEIVSQSLVFTKPEVSASDGLAVIRCEGIFRALYETLMPEGADSSVSLRSAGRSGGTGGMVGTGETDGIGGPDATGGTDRAELGDSADGGGAYRSTELYAFVEKRFPVSLTVESDEIKEDGVLGASLELRSLEPTLDIDAYGENRVIDLTYTVRALIETAWETEASVATDMFAEKYDVKCKSGEMVYERVLKAERFAFNLEKVFEIPSMTMERCLQCVADLSVSEVSVDEARDGITVKGVCSLSALGISGEDFDTVEHSVNFTERFAMSVPEGAYKVKARISPTSVTADVAGRGRLNVRISAELSANACCKYKETVLAEAELERVKESSDERPLIICYPVKNETLWEIASRYRVDPEKLLKKNSAVFNDRGVVAKEKAFIII